MKITRRELRHVIREMAWSGFVDNEKKRIANPPETDEIPHGGISAYGFPEAEESESREELIRRRGKAGRYLKNKRTSELYKKYFDKASLKDINIYIMPYIGSPIEFFANLSNITITDDNLYDSFSDGALKDGVPRTLDKLYQDKSEPYPNASIIPTYGGGDHGSVWESADGQRTHFIPFNSEVGIKIFEFFDVDIDALNLTESDTVILPIVNEFSNNYRPTPWRVIHALSDNTGPTIDGLDPNEIFGGDGWNFRHVGVSKSFRDNNIVNPSDVASEFITSAFFFGEARYNKDKLKELPQSEQSDFITGIEECNLYAKKLKEKMKGNIVLYVHY